LLFFRGELGQRSDKYLLLFSQDNRAIIFALFHEYQEKYQEKRPYLWVLFHGYEDKDHTCWYFYMEIRTKIIPAAIFPWISGQRSYLLLLSHGYQDKILSAAIFPRISGQRSWYFSMDMRAKIITFGIFP
jgi:hypothetical protein